MIQLSSDETHRARWNKGLMQMRVSGIPEGYISRVHQLINGMFGAVEPMSVLYRLTPPPERIDMSPPRMQLEHLQYVGSSPSPQRRFHQQPLRRVHAQLPHGPSPLRNHNAVVSLPLHLPTL